MERNSNIEILRIIAMLMIVVGHLYKFLNVVYDLPSGIDSFAITNAGVDIFVLISGLFGIKPTINKFVNLWLVTIFYSLLAAIIGIIVLDMPLYKLLTSFIKVASIIYSPYWFLITYFALMLFVPMINTILKQDKRTLLLYLIIFLFVDCIFQTMSKGFYGLTFFGGALFHFIALYTLARVITLWNIRLKTIYSVLFYIIVLVATISAKYICDNYIGFDKFVYFGSDTSPFIVLQSVALVLFFKSLCPMSLKGINKIASVVFAVYCFHTHNIMLLLIERTLNTDIFRNNLNNHIILFLYILFLGICIYILAIIIEYLRRIYSNQVDEFVTRYIKKAINSINI